MKVKVKRGIQGFSGRLDGAIYYYHPGLKKTLMRRMPEMPVQPQNHEYALIARQIKQIEPSEAFKNDFRVYLNLLREKDESISVPSWYPLYTKLLWDMQRNYPEQVNLKTITKAQILAEDLPCRSVKKAVEAGLLSEVPGYQYLDKEI